MSSNHPCKETVHLSVLFSACPLLFQLTRVPRREKRSSGQSRPFPRDRSSLLLRFANASPSRRFRSIKSASQFQPRVPPPLDLYRFQPITFSRGSRVAVPGHVPIVTRGSPLPTWTRYCCRSDKQTQAGRCLLPSDVPMDPAQTRV